VVRAPVAPRGGVVAKDLVAPRGVVGMLHDGEELDVGEAHVAHIVGELGRRLPVAEGALAVFRDVPPGAQVHLVDAHGGVEALTARTLGEPARVAPLIAVEALHDGGGARLVGLEAEGIGIALQRERSTGAGADLELVTRAVLHARQEELPDAVARVQPHGMTAAVPRVPAPRPALAPALNPP